MSENSLIILLLNQNWLAAELRSMGHTVVSAGLKTTHLDYRFDDETVEIDDLIARIGCSPDRIIYFDDSGLPWVTGLEICTIPKIFYSIDSHHHRRWHTTFAAIFDHVFSAHMDHVEDFRRFNPSCDWLPVWATVEPEPAAEREIGACFRGSMDPRLHPERARFFEQLGGLVPIDARPGLWLEAYPRAKIVVNQAVSTDLNFRIFEAMISGAMLITPRVENGLSQLFEDGTDMVLYEPGDAQDAAEKIRYYLDHDSQRRAVAQAGHAKTVLRHNNRARAETVASAIKGLRHERLASADTCAVATYIFCAYARREIGLPHSIGLARAAARAFKSEAAARPAADAEEDRTLDCLRIGSMLAASGSPDDAADFLIEAAGLVGASRLLQLFTIDHLLRGNRRDRAAAIAAEAGLPGSNLDSTIDSLIGEVKTSIAIRN